MLIGSVPRTRTTRVKIPSNELGVDRLFTPYTLGKNAVNND
jgi:hypothetical protein